jgi:NAD+ kinase
MDGPSEGTGVAADTVGVVGEHPAVVDALTDRGAEAVVGDAETVLDAAPDTVVAAGEPALVDLVRAGVGVPVLPFGVGPGVRSVPPLAVDSVLHLLSGSLETVERPVLRASTPLGGEVALFDVMLVTDEPARISEYAVKSGGTRVDTFRADGVVVATPAGSHGYARAADSPLVGPSTGVVSVVPISPFATNVDSWMLDTDGVSLVVERDETPVELLADGRPSGPVVPGETVRIRNEGSLTLAVVEESQSFFE